MEVDDSADAGQELTRDGHIISAMGARRVMHWRQPAAARTMHDFLALAAAVQAHANVTDDKTTRWAAEVTTRKRSTEADAPGMFLALGAKDVADEVHSCVLHHGESGKERTVLVLRAEKRCVEGAVPVKEYLSRCRNHRVTHRSKIEGVGFSAGDFDVRVGRVENMQGSYAGAVIEIEYVPVTDAAQAAVVLEEFAGYLAEAVAAAEERRGRGGGTLAPTPEALTRSYGLDGALFEDAHLAVTYVHAVTNM